MERVFFVGGNWKMNGSLDHCQSFVKDLGQWDESQVEVVIAPQALYVAPLKGFLAQAGKDSLVKIAGQNCHFKGNGAFTGENSASSLRDIGASWVILGHSERRTIFQESDKVVAEKVAFALSQGLKVIACIGETLQERESNATEKVILTQLEALKQALSSNHGDIVIAYEPVWAIGTGKVATPDQAQDVHAFIRKWLSQNISDKVALTVRIIYGGSVNGENCSSLAKQSDIDGFLVGGASLKPLEFTRIISSKL